MNEIDWPIIYKISCKISKIKTNED